MPGDGFLEPAAWHASLAGAIVTAGALVGDGAGRIMVVKPNYRDHWTLPGGICEFAEAPHAGCAREVTEELGLSLPVGSLLSVDWQLSSAEYGPDARPVMYFIFDCGVLPSAPPVCLQAEELDEWRFATEAELDGLLAPFAVARVAAAMHALASGGIRYVPQRAD